MALRVWLPLNGNLNNQGASGCNPIQSTAEVAKFYNNNAMSWCFWIYPTGSGGNAILGQQNMTTGNNRMFTIFQYPNPVDLHLSWQGEAQNNAVFLQTIVSNAFTASTWNHCAITYNGTTALIYVNGTLVGSINGTSPRTNFSYDVPLPSASNRYLCDLRIYDHVLSPKEIKEISKGLVVHYALDGGGRGLDNLGDFQSVANKWTNDGMSSLANYADPEHGNVLKMTNSSANVRIYRGVTNVWKSGQSYTVSFLARSATAGAVVNMSRSIADFSSNFTLTTSWKKYVGTINSTATADGGTLSFRVVSASAEVYLTNVKLENGTVNTPYIPGSGDPNYSTMGYGDNKEYDISGYGNHATRSGVSYETNSPKYSIGTLFASGNHITATLNSAGYSNTFTFAWWGKYTNYSSHMMWGYSNGNRLNLYMSGGNFYWNTGDGNGNPFGVSASTYGDDKWHHFAVTGDGTTVKLYIDGIFKGNASAFKAITGTSLIFNGWDTGTSYNFNGKLSDFRLYSTTLSADDVKELYQVSSSICNNGTVMCSDFLES